MTFEKIDYHEKIFNVADEPWPRGAWWWWFWLFFFDNPKNPSKPRQLMILWSTKNVDEIDCNDLLMKLSHTEDRSKLDGAVAAWYFDGEKMHHNYVLERGQVELSKEKLQFNSKTPSYFKVDGDENIIKIGDNMKFTARKVMDHDFVGPAYKHNEYPLGLNYSVLWLNHLELSGEVDGKPIKGSAYFQRVFVNAPAPSWYWGLFHFEKGQILSYYNAFYAGVDLKKDISYHDGTQLHFYKKISVERLDSLEKDIPKFIVSGENEDSKIKFTVQTYSHSSWTFKKKTMGVLPNKLVYNEYPSKIVEFEKITKKTNLKTTLKDLGTNVGNAEHTKGLLL